MANYILFYLFATFKSVLAESFLCSKILCCIVKYDHVFANNCNNIKKKNKPIIYIIFYFFRYLYLYMILSEYILIYIR